MISKLHEGEGVSGRVILARGYAGEPKAASRSVAVGPPRVLLRAKQMPRETSRPRTQTQGGAGPRTFPADSLERCHLRWHGLFFGVWRAISKHDPNLAIGLLLALEKAGLAEYRGDEPTFIPSLFEQNPSDDVLRKTMSFRHAASIPVLRGRIRGGRTRPPYLLILTEYYKALFEEKAKPSPERLRGESAHVSALHAAAATAGCSEEACRKHLERARELYPDLAKLFRRKGAKWEQTT